MANPNLEQALRTTGPKAIFGNLEVTQDEIQDERWLKKGSQFGGGEESCAFWKLKGKVHKITIVGREIIA